ASQIVAQKTRLTLSPQAIPVVPTVLIYVITLLYLIFLVLHCEYL
ncbi:hypothetical protein HNR32_002823, partial [Pectinatus brassicae]|nr:hypothetical protein [Pectinatus brassicae]